MGEGASAILSGLAVLVSIYAATTANKSAEAAIRSSNCSEIFDEYLIKKIPQARALLRFDETGRLCNGNALCEVLSAMNIASLFYRYDDNSFFNVLSVKCRKLEDTVAEAGNYPKASKNEQQQFWNEVQESLESIYKTIDTKRIGKTGYWVALYNKIRGL